jgi:rfaE bifunctional protein kinase chain/domain
VNIKGSRVVTIPEDRLAHVFNGFNGKRIAVVGDLMVDRYYWGAVTRISPEAPVPVVDVSSYSNRLGGAANVGNNIAALGGVPLLVGVVGSDEAGNLLRSLVLEAGFDEKGLLIDRTRPTTTKTRVIAHNQHVVRFDHEAKEDIGHDTEEAIVRFLEDELPSLSAIIIEDYNKGVVTRNLIPRVIAAASKRNIPVTVDPKSNNFFEYRNVSVFKPNRKETEEALGTKLKDQTSIEAAGRTLLERLSAENILLTMGERGMSLFEREGTITHVPTKAQHVADVSGAGDTVISTLTMALAAGASIREAATLSNFAGGIVCGEVGIVPVDPMRLYDAVLDDPDHSSSGD